MPRSIGKESGESVELVLKKKRGATVGKICRKVLSLEWNSEGWWNTSNNKCTCQQHNDHIKFYSGSDSDDTQSLFIVSIWYGSRSVSDLGDGGDGGGGGGDGVYPLSAHACAVPLGCGYEPPSLAYRTLLHSPRWLHMPRPLIAASPAAAAGRGLKADSSRLARPTSCSRCQTRRSDDDLCALHRQ